MKSRGVNDSRFGYGVVSYFTKTKTYVLLAQATDLIGAKKMLDNMYEKVLSSNARNVRLWDGRKKLTYISHEDVIIVEIVPHKRLVRMPFFIEMKKLFPRG